MPRNPKEIINEAANHAADRFESASETAREIRHDLLLVPERSLPRRVLEGIFLAPVVSIGRITLLINRDFYDWVAKITGGRKSQSL